MTDEKTLNNSMKYSTESHQGSQLTITNRQKYFRIQKNTPLNNDQIWYILLSYLNQPYSYRV